MLKFRKVNFAEYVLDKCKFEAWKFLEELELNIKPNKPKLLNEGLIKVNLRLRILGRDSKPDFFCDLDGDNCFLFSLTGEKVKIPDKKKLIERINWLREEYGKAF